MSTHVRVERSPVGNTTAEIPHDADDDNARLQACRSSLHTDIRSDVGRWPRAPQGRSTRGSQFIAPLLAQITLKLSGQRHQRNKSNKYGVIHFSLFIKLRFLIPPIGYRSASGNAAFYRR